MFILRKNELPPVGIVVVGQAIGGITADNCRPFCGVSPTKERGDCLSIVRPYAAGVGYLGEWLSSRLQDVFQYLKSRLLSV